MNPLDTLQAVLSAICEEPVLCRLAVASIELIVLAGAIAVLIRVARIRSPRLVYLLWAVVLFKPVVALTLGSAVSVVLWQVPIAQSLSSPRMTAGIEAWAEPGALSDDALVLADDPGVSTAVIPATASPILNEHTAHSPIAQLSLPQVILGLWAAGVAVGLIFYLVARLRLWNIVRAGTPAPAWVMARYRRIVEEMRLRRVPRLLVSDALESPALVGLVCPTILVPSWLMAETHASKVDWSLRHELTHWRWLDPVGVLIRDLAVTLFWFHPAVHWASGRLVESMELACDRAMLRDASQAGDYAEQLLRILHHLRARRRAVIAGGLFATRTQVGKRIAALLEEPFEPSPQLTARSAVGLMALAVVIFAVGGAVSRAGIAQNELSWPNLPQRVVHFPTDRCLGRVRLLNPAQRVYYGTSVFVHYLPIYQAGATIATPLGDIMVPAGQLVSLAISEDGWRDLSPLSQMRPDDLFEVSFPYAYPGDSKPDNRCMPDLVKLTGLKNLDLLHTAIDDRGLRQISPLRELEHLGVPERTGDVGMACIAQLPVLKSLRFHRNRVTDAGLAHLEKMKSLEALVLGGERLTDAGLVHLAALPNLRYLQIWGKFTDEALARVANVGSLRTLTVAAPNITDAGLAHLAKLDRLENLSLFDTEVTDAGLVYLTSMSALKRLDLGHTNVTDDGMAYLKQIASLEYLDLPWKGITDRGLADLAQLRGLKHLRVGTSSNSPITDAGLAPLSQLKHLESLAISGTGITNAGMRSIDKLTRLEKLNLFRTGEPLNEEGMAALTSLKSLRILDLYKPPITISNLNRLNALPNLTHLNTGKLTRDGAILDLSGLTQLEELSIRKPMKDRTLTDADMACLAKLKRLRRLTFCGDITDAGLAHLAGLTELERLGTGGPRVTDVGLAYLKHMDRLWMLAIRGGFTDQALREVKELPALGVFELQGKGTFSKSALKRLQQQRPTLAVRYFRDNGQLIKALDDSTQQSAGFAGGTHARK